MRAIFLPDRLASPNLNQYFDQPRPVICVAVLIFAVGQQRLQPRVKCGVLLKLIDFWPALAFDIRKILAALGKTASAQPEYGFGCGFFIPGRRERVRVRQRRWEQDVGHLQSIEAQYGIAVATRGIAACRQRPPTQIF